MSDPLLRHALVAIAAATASLAVPVAASAQATHVATPEERAAFQERADAQQKLGGALSRIAQDGRNGFALLDAGEAALALNDPQAALGFLARAENALPREGRVKSALGAAMMAIGRADQALRYFSEAQTMGARERTYLGDRALAFDLSGDTASAQRDYRAALAIRPGDSKLIRNYALSLGIAGDSRAALAMLNPLLVSQDRAAWRAQAFILAMNGQEKAAGETVDAVMPADLARDIKPYLARMDNLTPSQKAAAVHFGKFPSGPANVRVASADTRSPAVSTARKPTRAERDAARRAARDQARQAKTASALPPPVRTATRTPNAQRDTPATVATVPPPALARPQPGVSQASTDAAASRVNPQVASAAPTPTPSITSTPLPSSSAVQPGFSAIDTAQPQPQPQPAQAIVISPTAAARVSSPTATASSAPVYGPTITIDAPREKSLFDIVNAIDVPATTGTSASTALSASELERIKSEALAAQVAEEKREAAEKAKALAATKAKQEADAKAKQEAEAKKAEKLAKAANPARHWVQVATGGDVKALAFDYRRMAKKYPELFKGQDGWTSAWGRTQRLVVGPFDSLKDAKAWDADYRKAGGDSFTWSSTDGLEVEKLGGK